MITLAALGLTVLGKVAPKILGTLVDKGFEELQRIRQKAKVREEVRKDVEIKSLRTANRALEFLAQRTDRPRYGKLRLRDDAGDIEVPSASP